MGNLLLQTGVTGKERKQLFSYLQGRGWFTTWSKVTLEVWLFLYHKNWDIRDSTFFNDYIAQGSFPSACERVLRSQNWQDSFGKIDISKGQRNYFPLPVLLK